MENDANSAYGALQAELDDPYSDGPPLILQTLSTNAAVVPAWFRIGYAISNPLSLVTEDPCRNERVSANYATAGMFLGLAVAVLMVAAIPAGAAAVFVFNQMGQAAGAIGIALGNVANAHGNFAYSKGQNPNYYMRRT